MSKTAMSRSLTLSFPSSLWDEIDTKRSDVNRSLFIRRAVEHILNGCKNKKGGDSQVV
ncbi:MAG: hypothetical protein WA393_00755 [Nitrososphaeraceae archaeon]